ncbi:MAG: hypothetical protein RL693_2112 [Verrucomicrobiota bacterium]|jgi:two-component system phosphate regulon response regulator PhoB
MPDKTLILVADDEEDIRDLVCMNLRRAGYAVSEAADGLQALAQVKRNKPQAMVLDVMMPELDGFGVCRQIRGDSDNADIPIIMLTAKGQTQDRIEGLERGADDYLTKPFSPKELLLRVQSLLRRSAAPTTVSELKEGPFLFDLSAVKLTVKGEPIDLTLLEFKLFHLLVSKKGEVVERDAILREVWGYTDQVRTRTLDTHMKRLREKLADYSDWIHTARGFGYGFKAPEVASTLD